MLPADDSPNAAPDIYRHRFERCFRDHHAAGHVIANQYRSTLRRHSLDMRLAHETGAIAPGPDPAESLDRRDAFSATFALLGESEREVLRLIAWDGLDTHDAAQVFGCSPGAFRVRLHRARRKLAKQLEAAGHLPPRAPHRGSQPRGDSMNRKSRSDDALTRMRAANPGSATELRKAVTDAELSRAMRQAIAAGESPSRPIPVGDRGAGEHAGPTRSARGGVLSRHRGASLGLGGLACVAAGRRADPPLWRLRQLRQRRRSPHLRCRRGQGGRSKPAPARHRAQLVDRSCPQLRGRQRRTDLQRRRAPALRPRAAPARTHLVPRSTSTARCCAATAMPACGRAMSPGR